LEVICNIEDVIMAASNYIYLFNLNSNLVLKLTLSGK